MVNALSYPLPFPPQYSSTALLHSTPPQHSSTVLLHSTPYSVLCTRLAFCSLHAENSQTRPTAVGDLLSSLSDFLLLHLRLLSFVFCLFKIQKLEFRNQKPETRNQKPTCFLSLSLSSIRLSFCISLFLESRIWELETRNQNQETNLIPLFVFILIVGIEPRFNFHQLSFSQSVRCIL
ncbi:hypothetical protein L228DRAFT_124077 [Xylona heveae TC161]|uniref:Uncharacterized protein n=1 Tax=Xylona heveae (strain CBS 132557 / TC161) TaxID=1328760 RepID=A0A165HNY4_XYLHT|nr:hypothetical protein L228DRAFT_124077 [Xylona heveae TC161]KZF23788.1 hypothetical protein L228DRAFT_124077 [Xylona heveae TC161]